jgi:hypothetical protein
VSLISDPSACRFLPRPRLLPISLGLPPPPSSIEPDICAAASITNRCTDRPPPPTPGNLAVFPVLSRTSPVIYKDTIIIGTMQRSFGGFGYWLAVKKATGALVWGTQADPNIATVVTTSPTLHDDVLYSGVSSLEENVASRKFDG